MVAIGFKFYGRDVNSRVAVRISRRGVDANYDEDLLDLMKMRMFRAFSGSNSREPDIFSSSSV